MTGCGTGRHDLKWYNQNDFGFLTFGFRFDFHFRFGFGFSFEFGFWSIWFDMASACQEGMVHQLVSHLIQNLFRHGTQNPEVQGGNQSRREHSPNYGIRESATINIAGWARTFGSTGKGQKGSEVTPKKGGISLGKGLYSDENKGITSNKSFTLVQKVNGKLQRSSQCTCP